MYRHPIYSLVMTRICIPGGNLQTFQPQKDVPKKKTNAVPHSNEAVAYVIYDVYWMKKIGHLRIYVAANLVADVL